MHLSFKTCEISKIPARSARHRVLAVTVEIPRLGCRKKYCCLCFAFSNADTTLYLLPPSPQPVMILVTSRPPCTASGPSGGEGPTHASISRTHGAWKVKLPFATFSVAAYLAGVVVSVGRSPANACSNTETTTSQGS